MISTSDSPQFYGRRRGRKLGPLKHTLMETLLPQVRLSDPQVGVITKESPTVFLEIGFGGGEHLANLAKENPHALCLGVEVFQNGVASLLQAIHEQSLKNIRIFPEDVRLLLPYLLDASLDKIFVLFPDPWPKKKHHERRLLNPSTFALFARLLKPQGRLIIASDDCSYLEHIHECLSSCEQLILCLEERKSLKERPQGWTITRYEEKALKAGRKPQYFVLTKRCP
jgi:tRNA (guanine-N7-)-methyltransferase